MKKHDRIAGFLSGLPPGSRGRDPRYEAYFSCFNSGSYYEAHDVLENLWLAETGPDRDFYKGLIQIAGAFVHFKRQRERPDHVVDGRRLRPGCRLLRLGADYLSRFAPRHMGLDVDALTVLCHELATKTEASRFTTNPWQPDHGPHLEISND